ncbi:histone-lysine N-methyltransferase [Mycena alexandri]|uniref:Histone-lysine N-methyltransferase, H3 lysine-79 specific n=1 Tax=Mycena alexandri TaxID=1745969 RepID=A0AAD6X756_9AGAR|nr:histone-lysine N-methyltransferase [Mycena alexandri]KAJ7037416.1 histone-lysine N-methyltransferase [Mycena alexandri]
MALVAGPDYDYFGVSSSSTTTTTRVIVRKVHSTPPSSSPPRIKSNTSSPLSSPATSSPLSSPSRKRKSASLDSISGSDLALPRDVKRLRGDKPRKRAVSAPKLAPRASSQSKTLPPSPEPIYRSSRSRSGSHFTSIESDSPAIPRCWAADEDGGPDPDPAHFSSEKAVAMLLRTYCAYFKNLEDPSDCSFKPHPKLYPYVDLEYPNTYSSERFILLAPKDKDHYNPIMDVEKTLYTIIECYLTPAQQTLFGPIPKDTLFDSDEAPTPSPSPPRARSHSSSRSISSSSSSSDLDDLIILPNGERPNYLRAVQRAIHRRDGPSFKRAFDSINDILRCLKYPKLPADAFQNPRPNSLKAMVNTWTETGLPKKVLMRIIEENYQRSVGPHVQKLKQYEAFSSAVYGELMPSLVHEIIGLTKLKEDSLFLDLGSGVGNVVVQASLQTGCRSYGIELNPKPAKVARDMAANFKVRCRMWGLKVGDIELEEGDMLLSPRVNELISQADVVLVDNKVFEQSLNEQLRPKFLDLKEGAYVVSLAPFVPSLNARVTERNVDDISAIFDVSERPYHSGSVSWGNGGGTYYIHRVDRTGYASIRERFENSRGGRGSRRRP